jgi:opacity protein-like surface antigen
MNRTSMIIAMAVPAVAACCCAPSFADNLAGLNIGASVGVGDVRADGRPYGYPGYFDEHHDAWKVTAGIRPIAPLGVEAEYIDFGQPGRYYNSDYAEADVHATAAAVLGVAYLPLPLPLLDIYGKAGVARLQSNTRANGAAYCASVCFPSFSFRQDQTNTDFAYGAGVQTKFYNLALRAEYERISAAGGDPELYSVGVTWTF